MINVIIAKIELSLKQLFDSLIDLLFSPIWTVYSMVENIIEIWKSEIESQTDENNQEPQQEHHIKGFGK